MAVTVVAVLLVRVAPKVPAVVEVVAVVVAASILIQINGFSSR